MRGVRERYVRVDVPFDLYEIDLLRATDSDLVQISHECGLALSLEEMRIIQDYFRKRGRNPTDVEFQSLGQAWSEHCCYKSSKVFLREFIFSNEAPGVLAKGDAGVMEFDTEHAYALRIESHNHPSAVEPYGGAATGIGGIVRDVLCMGAKPIALIDPLHFGPLDYPYEKLARGVKHPKYLFGGVVAGIRDYGNRIGVPTVAGCVYFHEGYVGNIVVNVGCVGIAKKEHLQKNSVKGLEDIFVLVGGKTGRDGIHGVTFASLDLTEKMREEWRAGAVQLGDPIMKEPLIHACLEASQEGLLDGMKDLGGGGLSCVVGEMALAGGYGAEVHLDNVPLKETGLSPWEIWVSESQERMMLAVPRKHVERVIEIFSLYDVPATPIGHVIGPSTIRVLYNGIVVLELDLEFLTRGPEYCRPYSPPEAVKEPQERIPPEPRDYGEMILRVLSSPNVASKEWVIRQYDHEVKASTAIKPLQGKIGKAAHGDASVLKPLRNSWRGLAITCSSTPQFASIDPFRGGASAVDEMCRNLVAVGARPHSMSDCLNFGNPEKPDRLWYFREAVRGIGHVASSLNIAIPSGNVSFYNETPFSAVPPTPVVLAVGIVDDIRRCVTSDLKREGNVIFLVGTTKDEMGGSEYYQLVEGHSPRVPDVDPVILKRSIESLLDAIKSGLVASCHDISHGGLAACIAEMCLGGDIGARLELSKMGNLRLDFKLFSESNTRWLVEVEPRHFQAFLDGARGLAMTNLGYVGGEALRIAENGKEIVLPLEDLRERWTKPIFAAMGG